MATPVSMKQLLEAGVHFGHQTRRWDPRMRPFIFTERNGIHIIDLQQTVGRLGAAMEFVRDLVANGQDVLYVGTKKQAQEAVELEAKRAQLPYVTNRWLGGTLTNFATISRRIEHLLRLEDQIARGEFHNLPKKEVLRINDQIDRLNRYFGGIKSLARLPGALFIVDPTMERIAVAEAIRMKVPIVAMCDTNSNPDEIDYPIPSNDDAIRAVKLIASRIADAALEGLAMREYAGGAGFEASEEEFQGEAYSASPDDPAPAAVEPDTAGAAGE